MQEMHKGKLYICYKGAPTHQLKKSNKHQAPPANEWKLLDLGVWWKYQIFGHVWVHGSKRSFLSLHCLSGNDTSLLCAWFWSEALGSFLTKVTHGVCDPKELRATTSCSHILCLSSGLSNTRMFAGRPRHQKRVPEVYFLSNRYSTKSAFENPWRAKEEDTEYQRPKSGLWRKYLKMRLTACRIEVLGDTWKWAHWHTENWMPGLVAVR
jgi:hypothetical protein